MKTKRTDRPTPPAEPGPRKSTTDTPLPHVDLEESMAGEEDPGAAMDMTIEPRPDPGKPKRQP